MKRPKWLYTVLVPVVWAITCYVGFDYPGDEYGLWVAGSLPGVWTLLVFPLGGDIRGCVWIVVLTGSVVMAALGRLLDWLRCPFVIWHALWVFLAGVLFLVTLAQYPTWSRAIARNGSFLAYALSSMNFALLASTVVMIVMTPVCRGVWWVAKAIGYRRAVAVGKNE